MQEYIFKVQATTQPGQNEDRLITVGKVKINMAQFATLGHKEHQTILQMPFTLGRTFSQALPFGQLRLNISAHMVKVSCHATAQCWRLPFELLLPLLLQPVGSFKYPSLLAVLACPHLRCMLSCEDSLQKVPLPVPKTYFWHVLLSAQSPGFSPHTWVGSCSGRTGSRTQHKYVVKTGTANVLLQWTLTLSAQGYDSCLMPLV